MILKGHVFASSFLPNLYEVTILKFSNPKLALMILTSTSSAILFLVPLLFLCSLRLNIVRFSSLLFLSSSSLLSTTELMSFLRLFTISSFPFDTCNATSCLVFISKFSAFSSRFVILVSCFPNVF